MVRHDEGDAGTDEGKLNDERIEVSRRIIDQVTQDVCSILFANFFGLFGHLEPVHELVASLRIMRVTDHRALLLITLNSLLVIFPKKPFIFVYSFRLSLGK